MRQRRFHVARERSHLLSQVQAQKPDRPLADGERCVRPQELAAQDLGSRKAMKADFSIGRLRQLRGSRSTRRCYRLDYGSLPFEPALDAPGAAVPHCGLVTSIFPLAGVRAVDILVKMTF